MAKFTIETTKEEQDAVLAAIKKFEDTTVSMRAIAVEAKMPQSRARYAVLDLLEANKIARVPTKAFNAHYVRYTYKVL